MNSIRPLIRSPVLRNGTRRAYHDTGDFRPVSMDELPVPNGSWKADYDARQKKYNMHLIGGVVFSIATVVAAKVSGLCYLNWAPPDSID